MISRGVVLCFVCLALCVVTPLAFGLSTQVSSCESARVLLCVPEFRCRSSRTCIFQSFGTSSAPFKSILDGVRVLDFGRFIAGPYCAALLGDFGAEVIRIERLDGGEDRWTGPVSATGDGANFIHCGRNKKGNFYVVSSHIS